MGKGVISNVNIVSVEMEGEKNPQKLSRVLIKLTCIVQRYFVCIYKQ